MDLVPKWVFSKCKPVSYNLFINLHCIWNPLRLETMAGPVLIFADTGRSLHWTVKVNLFLVLVVSVK